MRLSTIESAGTGAAGAASRTGGGARAGAGAGSGSMTWRRAGRHAQADHVGGVEAPPRAPRNVTRSDVTSTPCRVAKALKTFCIQRRPLDLEVHHPVQVDVHFEIRRPAGPQAPEPLPPRQGRLAFRFFGGGRGGAAGAGSGAGGRPPAVAAAGGGRRGGGGRRRGGGRRGAASRAGPARRGRGRRLAVGEDALVGALDRPRWARSRAPPRATPARACGARRAATAARRARRPASGEGYQGRGCPDPQAGCRVRVEARRAQADFFADTKRPEAFKNAIDGGFIGHCGGRRILP